MRNQHAGEVTITIGGRSYTLVYDWAAIASLTDAFGKEFDGVLGEAMDKLDTAVLARALETGGAAPMKSIAEGIRPMTQFLYLTDPPVWFWAIPR